MLKPLETDPRTVTLREKIAGIFCLLVFIGRAMIPWGSWLCPVLPKRTVDMLIVVGPEIRIPKIENPTKDDVTKWHETYMAALVKIFEDHKKDVYGPEAKGVKRNGISGLSSISRY